MIVMNNAYRRVIVWYTLALHKYRRITAAQLRYAIRNWWLAKNGETVDVSLLIMWMGP
jgi:hypothetical protein